MTSTGYEKAIIALVMAVLGILDQIFGITLGISEQWVTMVIFAVIPVLVWAVPNRGQ